MSGITYYILIFYSSHMKPWGGLEKLVVMTFWWFPLKFNWGLHDSKTFWKIISIILTELDQ
jgi:hypothetical protein